MLSVATGLGNIKDGNIVQAMAQAQANSLDRWNEYQATRTKLHIVETARAQLAAVGGAGAAGAIAKFDTDRAKYSAETPKLAKEAQGFADEYDALNVHDDQFDAAEASLAISISIAAVAALTESWVPLVASWVIGAFGLFNDNMRLCRLAVPTRCAEHFTRLIARHCKFSTGRQSI